MERKCLAFKGLEEAKAVIDHHLKCGWNVSKLSNSCCCSSVGVLYERIIVVFEKDKNEVKQ